MANNASCTRVLQSVRLQVPDKIPCDYHGIPAVNTALYRHLGIQPEYCALLTHLGSDIVDIRGTVDPTWVADFAPKWQLPNGDWRNYLGFTTRVVTTSFGEIEEHTTGVFANAQDLADLLDFRYPSPDWFDFSDMPARLAPYRNFAVMASGPSVFQHPSFLRGIDNLLCDFLVNPEMAHFVINKFAAYYLAYMERLFENCKGLIDIMRIADDLGTQIAPLLSEQVAQEFLFGHIKDLCALAHSYNVKVMMHSCGSIFPFIDTIIGCGVDILDPIQPLAKNMHLASVKQAYGDRICLHGGIDTQQLLPHGTPGQVRKSVYEAMELYRGQGGYIIAPAHVMQPDVPIDNILAMYGAIADFNGGKAL